MYYDFVNGCLLVLVLMKLLRKKTSLIRCLFFMPCRLKKNKKILKKIKKTIYIKGHMCYRYITVKNYLRKKKKNQDGGRKMKLVSTADYEKNKIAFLHKHVDWTVETSPMDEYGRYYKTYVCEDGAVYTEVNEPAYEMAKAEVEVKGIKVEIEQEVKLFRTEGWNTDNAESIVCYEKF